MRPGSIDRPARALLLAWLTCLAACDIPRDPEGTLDRVSGGTLRVGLSEAGSWVRRGDRGPEGVEPELLRRFARSLGADVEWRWGTVADHMEALQRYELDVVAAGLTRDTPWRSHVGLTAPYRIDTTHTVAPPGSSESHEVIRHRVMAVPPGENGFLFAIEDALEAARPDSSFVDGDRR